eukprot:6120732-Pleurochrysis_carterae.AAC.1
MKVVFRGGQHLYNTHCMNKLAEWCNRLKIGLRTNRLPHIYHNKDLFLKRFQGKNNRNNKAENAPPLPTQDMTVYEKQQLFLTYVRDKMLSMLQMNKNTTKNKTIFSMLEQTGRAFVSSHYDQNVIRATFENLQVRIARMREKRTRLSGKYNLNWKDVPSQQGAAAGPSASATPGTVSNTANSIYNAIGFELTGKNNGNNKNNSFMKAFMKRFFRSGSSSYVRLNAPSNNNNNNTRTTNHQVVQVPNNLSNNRINSSTIQVASNSILSEQKEALLALLQWFAHVQLDVSAFKARLTNFIGTFSNPKDSPFVFAILRVLRLYLQRQNSMRNLEPRLRVIKSIMRSFSQVRV